MLRGYVDRRTNPRAPFQTQLTISFFQGNKELSKGISSDISAGGMQFYSLLESDFAKIGDKVELVFQLDLLGRQTILSEVCHKSYGIDNDLNRVIFYGVKFIDLTIETWNYIYDYCASQPQNTTVFQAQKIIHERMDIRIDTILLSHLQLTDQKIIPCIVDDLSYGGAKIHLPIELKINEPIKLFIENPELDFPFNGKCIWSGPVHQNINEFYAGISFDRLDIELFNKLRMLLFRISSIAK